MPYRAHARRQGRRARRLHESAPPASRSRRTVWQAVLGVAAALVATVLNAPAFAADTIKIGVAGPHTGHSLDEFDLPQLTAMVSGFDAESVALLESYLARRFPAWREHAQGNAAGGQGRAAASGKMTDEEAYQILGLKPGAGRDEIGRAHRALMKKLHPDQGGSTYLAARVNEAKDTLLRTHHNKLRRRYQTLLTASFFCSCSG